MGCRAPHICRRLLAGGALLLLLNASAWALEVVLAVHPETRVESLSSQDVQMIFLGKKTAWNDGTPIVPFVQVESELTEAFINEKLGLTPRQYYLYWRKALFTGQGIPPAEVAGDTEMQQRLLATPGAIGYLARGALAPGVSAITVR